MSPQQGCVRTEERPSGIRYDRKCPGGLNLVGYLDF